MATCTCIWLKLLEIGELVSNLLHRAGDASRVLSSAPLDRPPNNNNITELLPLDRDTPTEANTREKRLEWLAALEKVQMLKPKKVVAGHKREGESDDVHHLEFSIGYIETYQSLLDSGVRDISVLYKAMMKKYGSRVNSHALLGSCWAAEAAGWK